jgi:hypothetical protein
MSTTSRDLHAPLFTTTWDLCVWLLDKTRTQPHDVLARSLAEEALRLLDAVTLALKNLDRDLALADADVLLIRLRLAMETALEPIPVGLPRNVSFPLLPPAGGGWAGGAAWIMLVYRPPS